MRGFPLITNQVPRMDEGYSMAAGVMRMVISGLLGLLTSIVEVTDDSAAPAIY